MAETASVINAKGLSQIINRSERRIQQLAKEGVVPKAERGKYPFVLFMHKWCIYLDENRAVTGGGEGVAPDYVTERTRLLRANADKSELELSVMRGESLPADAVHLIWTKQIAAFRAKMLSMPIKLAAELHGIEKKKEIQEIAKQFIWEALNELADSDGPDYNDIAATLDGEKDSSSTA